MVPMKLDPIYYKLIQNKQKLYENECMTLKRQKLKLLDIVEFTNRETSKKMNAKIVELSHFKNFEMAIRDCGLKKVMPNESVEDAVKLYEAFPHDEGKLQKKEPKNTVFLELNSN